ncbi:hypothetical protein [Pseudactinotalea terrae]|uniref:hypothetical protein n=1 Tax=Pseudactinotalea terrae TaxID=1743262 RepID=UPI0012E19DD0|nr:hypothetical protein [Pseudactinotalea terrae]
MATPDDNNREKVPVRLFEAGDSEIAVFEFEGQLRDLMVSSLQRLHLTTGSYVSDAKAMSPQGVLSMAVAGASGAGTALSASLSSTLYMATADPATLMQLGGGVGSAVMGVNGIVAQAPFIAIPSALPVLAPMMAMQALTTVVMLQQFQQVDRKLDTIKSTLDTAIARSEATHVGELLTASNIVDEVYQRYEREGSFSIDMLVRLALAEHDVRRLAGRFRYLVDSHSAAQVDEIADVRRANYDAHSAMLASFLDLRVSYLRVCVDMQEHPKSVSSSVEQLKEKIGAVTEFWQQLLNRSDVLREAIRERETQLNDMKWAERVLPEFIGGRGAAAERKLKALKDAYVSTMENELGIMKDFDSLIHSAKQTLRSLEQPAAAREAAPTLVYWRDETGEHSFYTEQLRVA